MAKGSKILTKGNDEFAIEMSGYDMLFCAMIYASLEDYWKEPPDINREYCDLYWLVSVYYPECRRIEIRKKDAELFFDHPDSLFNKYYKLDKEYLIKHYYDKHVGKDKTQRAIQRD